MINKVILIGRLGADPEIRFMPTGGQVTSIILATTRTWKKDGQKHEDTEWHNVVFYNKLAEIAGEYLKKGSLVYVEGRIKTDKVTGNDGQIKYFTKILSDEMKILSGSDNKENDESSNSFKNKGSNKPSNDRYDDFDDSIPF